MRVREASAADASTSCASKKPYSSSIASPYKTARASKEAAPGKAAYSFSRSSTSSAARPKSSDAYCKTCIATEESFKRSSSFELRASNEIQRHEGTKTSRHQDIKTSRHQDIKTSRHQDTKT
eukprot:scaffold7329_cov222-Pinguiococcus_pyrenoidosus.AAC.1